LVILDPDADLFGCSGSAWCGLLYDATDFQVMLEKYGKRGYRFGLMEAGHIARNMQLNSLHSA
jgi:hypothetical protein